MNKLAISFLKSNFFHRYFSFEDFPSLNKIKRSEDDNLGVYIAMTFCVIPALLFFIGLLISLSYLPSLLEKEIYEKTIATGLVKDMMICLFFFIANGFAAFYIYIPLLSKILNVISARIPCNYPDELLVLFSQNPKLNKIKISIQPRAKEFLSNPKSFCLAQFNKTGSGFLEFMTSRVKAEKYFLNYALSIPRKKELSVDSLRRILLAYQPGIFKGVADLETVFANYSLEQIERIFTFVGDKGAIFSQLSNTPAPVVDSFNELITLKINKKLLIFDTTEIDGFHFRILKTKHDYTSASEEFSNCVRNKFANGNTIIIAYKDGKGTCIEVNESSVTQMASYYDKISPHRRELSKLLKSKGFKIKFTLPHIL